MTNGKVEIKNIKSSQNIKNIKNIQSIKSNKSSNILSIVGENLITDTNHINQVNNIYFNTI